MDRPNTRKISRRRFVEQAGLGAATLAGAGAIGTVELQAQQNAAGAVPTTWDFEAAGEKSWT